MRLIDLHCDTITELRPGESLSVNERMVNLSDLKEAQVLVQCCSMFVPTGLLGNAGIIESECDRIYNTYQKEMKENAESVRKILTYDDILACQEDGKTGIMLTIEDAGVLFGSQDAIFDMYHKGVRLITLTWNHENELAYPNSDNYQLMNLGLKELGHILVDRMFKIGMMVDV
ncbi:MAG: membrane dipeptidase, partial [Lachnospira sp.]|nr:membrane dipeptidase [Lachnospira sp.]